MGSAVAWNWRLLCLACWACCCHCHRGEGAPGAPGAAQSGDASRVEGSSKEEETSSLLQQASQRPWSEPEGKAGAPRRGRGGCHRAKRRHHRSRPQQPTLDAKSIPKYVTPLVIPPVMRRSESQGRKHSKSCPEYEIALRQIEQQILPGNHWNSFVWGILDELLPADKVFNSTTVWSYGPLTDPRPDSSDLPGGAPGLAPAGNSQFNYPAYTIENIKDVRTKVSWFNHLVKDPWRCRWDYPVGEACKFIEHLLPIDQSLHWANPKGLTCRDADREQDCRPVDLQNPKLAQPYRGPVPMVVHVHGGHTDAHSDGYPEAWWMPAASNLAGFAQTGSLVNKFGRLTNTRPGEARFEYRNDQRSATLWFHDHTLGMTRNNVYAGPAGFWLVREKNLGETGLLWGRLPGPPPRPGEKLEQVNLPAERLKYCEIPIVIQDRSFNKDGSLFYPRDRAFFEDVSPEDLRIPLTGNASAPSDVPSIWNPEAFFDVMVVNGNSWPVLPVTRSLYRFRLLNGCGSRFLNLAFCVVDSRTAPCEMDGNGKPVREVEIYQIGSDQGLLPKVVQVSTGYKTALRGDGSCPTMDWEKTPALSPREALLLGPAERADVIVDFGKFPPGTIIRMVNTGPDAPFGGFGDDFEMADPETTGQVMQFQVIGEKSRCWRGATPPWQLKLGSVGELGPVDKARDLALLEEESKLICAKEEGDAIVWDPTVEPDLDNPGTCKPKPVEPPAHGPAPRPRPRRPIRRRHARGPRYAGSALQTLQASPPVPFGPTAVLMGVRGSTAQPLSRLWVDPITERPKLGTTEIWDFWNWSEDSHPIHIHLVAFRVIGRISFSREGPKLLEHLPNVPTEDGWKDTVIAYPNQVTRVAATYDLPGLYVMHCHILEHEDNEMMRPYCIVGKDGKAPGCGAVP
uniref:Plastocyanin-like domain-containing protein n=1 Tax=Alexandrium monilatum TaxID=311494 RepID=A0A7S4VG53_9DINO